MFKRFYVLLWVAALLWAAFFIFVSFNSGVWAMFWWVGLPPSLALFALQWVFTPRA